MSRYFPPQFAEDRARDVFLAVERAIRGGEVRGPGQLAAFVREAMKRQGKGPARELARLGAQDGDRARERADVMSEVLQSFPQRDREALVRFYLREQTEQQICASMRISAAQFRVLKSRARERFSVLSHRPTAVA
jgi:DNA-directed RNA polymerase specialized sigma24 family protein